MEKTIFKLFNIFFIKFLTAIFLVINSKLTSLICSSCLAYSFVLLLKHPKVMLQLVNFKVFLIFLIFYHLYFGFYSILKDYSHNTVFNVSCSLFFSSTILGVIYSFFF